MQKQLFFAFIFLLIFFPLVIIQQMLALIFGHDCCNILVVAVLFISILFRYSWALVLGAMSGLLLDWFSFSYGIWSIPLISAILITNFLFVRFFTNRSLWTLILLGGVGTSIAYLLHAIFTKSFASFFSIIASQLLSHTVLFILLFFAAKSFTTHLKPYILIRTLHR